MEPVMTPQEMQHRLWVYGFYCDGDPLAASRVETGFSTELNQSILRFRKYHFEFIDQIANERGISESDASITLLSAPRCALPDVGMRVGLEANWPKDCRNDLLFQHPNHGLSPLSPEETETAFVAAARNWSQILDVLIHSDGESRSDPDIIARWEPMGTNPLAWSELARNTCNAQLRQAYNSSPGVFTDVDFLSGTVTHELGHALGLGHLQDRAAIMYPYMRRDVLVPSDVDIEAMVRIGYERQVPEPPPPSPGSHIVSVEIRFADGSSHKIHRPDVPTGTPWGHRMHEQFHRTG